MPELPEVETVCRGLEKEMKGRDIARVTLRRPNLRIPFSKDLAKLRNVRVTSIGRRAKYILINLKNGKTMIVHLGMSGRMVAEDKGYRPQLHDHMILSLGSGKKIVFNDPRRFGLVDLSDTERLDENRFLKHLGPEPLARAFSTEYLAENLAGKKPDIKIAIMDQRIVVGVGNIYASEALYEAGIDPRRKSSSITRKESKKLVTAIKNVLKRAIRAGGSSLRDYVKTDGELGYFQHHWAVYDKEGEKCPSCKEKKGCILKITQGGRSTYFCPRTQK